MVFSLVFLLTTISHLSITVMLYKKLKKQLTQNETCIYPGSTMSMTDSEGYLRPLEVIYDDVAL